MSTSVKHLLYAIWALTLCPNFSFFRFYDVVTHLILVSVTTILRFADILRNIPMHSIHFGPFVAVATKFFLRLFTQLIRIRSNEAMLQT